MRILGLLLLGLVLSAASCDEGATGDPGGGGPSNCGNGEIDAGEDCDNAEGNSDVRPNACRTTCIAAGCGDGVVDDGEACDDGNTNELDACLSSCVAASCGDGKVQRNVEQCDEGDANSDDTPDACREDCKVSSCGDGVVDRGEACDNEAASCVDCQVSGGCGDGKLDDETEECDDGPDNSDTRPDACRTDCVEAHCGDGVSDDPEECDDGAGNSNTLPDACRLTCVEPTCGDKVVDIGEDCDDGNEIDGDGCSECEFFNVFPALASALTIEGSIDPASNPVMGHLLANDGPNSCDSVEKAPAPYAVIDIANPTGELQVAVIEAHFSQPGVTLSLYFESFDPVDPMASCAGASSSFDWELDPEGGAGARIGPVIIPDTGTVYLVAQGPVGLATSVTYRIQLSNAAPTVREQEPNDDTTAATVIHTTDETAYGQALPVDTDLDVFTFQGVASTRYRVEVLADNGNCFARSIAASLEIDEADGTTLVAKNESHPYYDPLYDTGCAGLTFNADTTGTYYAKVHATGGEPFEYFLLLRKR